MTRQERRVQEREAAQTSAAQHRQSRQAERTLEARTLEARNDRLRKLAFGGIVVAVLAVGTYLAFGDFDLQAAVVIDTKAERASALLGRLFGRA